MQLAPLKNLSGFSLLALLFWLACLVSLTVARLYGFCIDQCADFWLACLVSLTVAIVGCQQELNQNEFSRASLVVPDTFTKVGDSIFRRPFQQPVSIGKGLKKRFTRRLDCGVEHKNYLSRHHTNILIETGGGVALGDFDNDGLVDIYLTGSDVANRLYKNLGGFRFEDVTESANVDGRVKDQLVWASGATFADVDNDGDLDLYVCNMAAPNLLYINQNDGSFVEQSKLAGCHYIGASKQANFCDYDRDGDLDLYLLTYQDLPAPREPMLQERNGVMEVIPGKEEFVGVVDGHKILAGERDVLFQNNGKGEFIDVTEEAGISGYGMGLSCNWFDFDNDQWQDLYVGSDFKKPDKLYRNNRDGTFTNVLPNVATRTTWFTMGMDSGDLNNDGWLDLMIADMADPTHYGQKINMGAMGSDAWFLSSGKPRQFMKNCVFINSGTGQFMEVAEIAGLAKTDWTWAVRMVDMDNDGMLDIFVTNGHARDNMNSDLTNHIQKLRKQKGVGEEQIQEIFRNVPPRKNTNMAFRNRGSLGFESVGEKWGLDHTGVSHAAAFADLDNDGDLDCVVNNYYKPTLVYENNTVDQNSVCFEFRCRENNYFGVGTRVEVWQDGNYQRKDLQPSRGYLGCDPMYLHFGLAQSTTVDQAKITWPDGTLQTFAGLAPNGLYRVVESKDRDSEKLPITPKPTFANLDKSMALGFTHQESQHDDFEREPLLPFQLSRLGGSIACGDINGDGFVDVYCGGAAGQAGEMLINHGGKFEPLDGPWKIDSGCEDMSCLFFDADGDGKTDLYVTSGSNEFEEGAAEYQDRLYRNLGNEKFEDVTDMALPEFFSSSHSVASVDFDRDGDLDLFIGSRSVPGKYPLTPKSYLLINDNGVFGIATEVQSGGAEDVGLVNSAVWSDFDSDGWPDLLIAVEWGPIVVFKNKEGTLVNVTDSVGLGEQLGWWHGITAADLDADGDMDYVVTNQGRNTKYHATPEHPHRLYYDDFDDNGTLDLVEAEYEGEIEYPVRGRSCSSRCMPFIADKFKTFHDYSLASISDIYQVEKSPRPVRELRVLDSVVLWNEEGSGFRMEPLPKLAQISPGYGVCVSDFDGDGFQDILMATNFFGSQPETGYMDGGLGWLLKGSKDKQFEVSWPNQSGVVIDGDANGLALADVDNDGDQDALFAVNNQPFRLLKNESASAAVQVVVNGTPGNASGIGTRIVLLGDEDDKAFVRQAFEISAGGSYLAQSSAQPTIAMSLLEKTRSIEIHWPDGTVSTLEDSTPKNGRLVLSYPSN